MKKEVNISTYLVISLLLLVPTNAVMITPQAITIDEYDSVQENVITILNDEFEPIGFDITTDYLSAYLNEYIQIKPKTFLLQPGEQQNIKVLTSFPQEFFPQQHKAFLHMYPDSKEGFTITIKPTGTQQQSLALEDITTTFNDHSLTITMDLVNTGNVVLFVTPQLFVSQHNTIIKNITYPQPVVILPGEVYPLTLRQDNSEFRPGTYTTTIQARYKADTQTKITKQETIPFTITEEAIEEENNWWIYVAALLSGIIIIGSIIWSITNKKPRKRKEKHIIHQQPELIVIQKDVNQAKKDLSTLTKDIKELVEATDNWIRAQ